MNRKQQRMNAERENLESVKKRFPYGETKFLQEQKQQLHEEIKGIEKQNYNLKIGIPLERYLSERIQVKKAKLEGIELAEKHFEDLEKRMKDIQDFVRKSPNNQAKENIRQRLDFPNDIIENAMKLAKQELIREISDKLTGEDNMGWLSIHKEDWQSLKKENGL